MNFPWLITFGREKRVHSRRQEESQEMRKHVLMHQIHMMIQTPSSLRITVTRPSRGMGIRNSCNQVPPIIARHPSIIGQVKSRSMYMYLRLGKGST
jgi:hypothetical protein